MKNTETGPRLLAGPCWSELKMGLPEERWSVDGEREVE